MHPDRAQSGTGDEAPPDAEKTAAALTPAGKKTFDQLLRHRDQLKELLLREITLHKDEMDAVSPHGHLAQMHTAVFLLHGAGDTIIPSSETLWLAKDVPQTELKTALVSPALVNASLKILRMGVAFDQPSRARPSA
jgi:hypothetical protein